MIRRLRRRLGRLRVTQRLALLVLVPLAAVVLLAVPVVADRADQARAAAAIADEAQTRRVVGGLMEELQRERLLSLLYLAQPGAESLAVVRQSQAVNDALEEVRRSADPRLRAGVGRLTELLGVVRPRVQNRSVLGLVAHTLFSQAAAAVLDEMPPPTAAGSTASVPPVGALDELLRANEQAARVGAAALVAVTEPITGRQLVADASTAQRVHTGRFAALASPDQRALLESAENSQAAGRVGELAGAPATPGPVDVAAVRLAGAVETYTTLRRLVGDGIAGQIADDAAAAANRSRTTAIVVSLLALLLLVVVAGLAAAGARSIAVPLARLNAAAVAVAAATGRELERVSDDESQAEAAPTLRAVPTTGPGDVADLAAAFNQVQESAAALLARQLTTRRNVSAMFATVARRTRNLADRQLNLIDVLERQQQDAQLLDRLYRLDHVATRLRRSASALLVVSGAPDDVPGNPMRLADVVRAAAAEIEQFTRVELVDVVEIAAAPGLAPDLILLVAELLDNAVSYSPPPSPVRVSIGRTGSGCRLSIADSGIGMSDEQLDAENRRLVERERLDIAPTQVLGLFVVGRLARRHGLDVTLTASRPQGVTVHIDVPGRLLTATGGFTVPAPQPRGARHAGRRAVEPGVPERALAAMRAVSADSRFAWFDGAAVAPGPAVASGPVVARHAATAAPDGGSAPAVVPVGAAPAPALPAPPPPLTAIRAQAPDPSAAGPAGPSGLSRRVPGRNLPGGSLPSDPGYEPAASVDPAAARVEMEALATGLQRARTPAGGTGPDGAGPDGAGPDGAGPGAAIRGGHPVVPPPQWPLPAPVQAGAPGGPRPLVPRQRDGAQRGLTRRVPGANLVDDLRPTGGTGPGRAGASTRPGGAPPSASAPAERDPAAERRALDVLVAGFARGAAAPPTGPYDHPAAQRPGDPSPTFQFNAGAPVGPEPQNVERR